MSKSYDLERENQELTETILTAYETIEGAIELTDFQDTITSSTPVRKIIELTGERVRRILPFHTSAFFLVNENSGALDLHSCRPAGDSDQMEKILTDEVSLGNVHTALRDQRPMLRHLADKQDERLLLHAICTARRCRGMFAGIYRPGEQQSDRLSLLLLTLILSHCANALESADLYILLQRTNRELIGAAEYARMQLEHVDEETADLLEMIQQLQRFRSQQEDPEEMATRLSIISSSYKNSIGTDHKRSIDVTQLLESEINLYTSAFGIPPERIQFKRSGSLPELPFMSAMPYALTIYEILASAFHRSTPPETPEVKISVHCSARRELTTRLSVGRSFETIGPESKELLASLINERLGGTITHEGRDLLLLFQVTTD